MTEAPMQVLLVDDSPEDADLVREALALAPPGTFDLRHVTSLEDGMASLGEHTPDIVLLDLSLPDAVGIDAVRRVHAASCGVPIVVLTGLSDDVAAPEAVREGAQDFITKHDLLLPGLLVRSMRYAIERHALLREIYELNRGLERRVGERTAELESFSYSVSHDLRQPLRAIGSFTDLLLADHADALDEEGRGYLRRIKAAGTRMATVIDGLLSLSRVARTDLQWEPVYLGAIAMSIAAELRAADPGRTVSFLIEEDLQTWGDSSLLRVAVQNLMGNAWKFTAGQVHATIEVAKTVLEGEVVFFVRDNGAGFDMTYADRLFEPFQRLHSAGEFEGSGIGLPTVLRVVERHGGRIWAESATGEGATFYFTLGAGGEAPNRPA